MGLKSENDNDRQAAEDYKSLDCAHLAWLIKKSQAFYSDGCPTFRNTRSTSVDPPEVGSAKRKKAMFRNFKVLLIALVVIVLAASSYAFAASITGIPTSKAGTGSGAVSGYAVSAVAYTFNSTDPSKLDSVTFTLDGVATLAKIEVDTVAGVWYNCIDLDGVAAVNDWSCNTTVGTQATAAAMDTLTIVASDH